MNARLLNKLPYNWPVTRYLSSLCLVAYWQGFNRARSSTFLCLLRLFSFPPINITLSFPFLHVVLGLLSSFFPVWRPAYCDIQVSSGLIRLSMDCDRPPTTSSLFWWTLCQESCPKQAVVVRYAGSHDHAVVRTTHPPPPWNDLRLSNTTGTFCLRPVTSYAIP